MILGKRAAVSYVCHLFETLQKKSKILPNISVEEPNRLQTEVFVESGMLVHACNPNTWEAQAGVSSQVQGQPRLQRSPWPV